MFERLAASCLTGYAVWHAYKHARRPRWASCLHADGRFRDDDLAYRVVYRPHYYVDLNADIGGRVGLGHRTVGYAGKAAAY